MPPSSDGSFILQPNVVCTLIDSSAAVWKFDGISTHYGNMEFTQNGAPYTSALELYRNFGVIFYNAANTSPQTVWFRLTASGFYQTADQFSAVPVGPFKIKAAPAGSVVSSWNNPQDAAGAITTGQTLQLTLQPAGFPYWNYAFPINGPNNITIIADPGVKLEAAQVFGQAAIVLIGNGHIVQGDPTVPLEIAWVQGAATSDDFCGIQIDQGSLNCTISNVYIHDCDLGIESGGKNDAEAGTFSTILVQNSTLIGCGTGGRGPGFQHNIYIGSNPPNDRGHDLFSFQGSKSLQSVETGHLLKSRASATDVGTTTTCILGHLDANGARVCDIPFGGVVRLWNSVFEQGTDSDNNDMFGFGSELAGYTGPAVTHSLDISNNFLIFDSVYDGIHPNIVCNNNFAFTGVNGVVRNCVIIGNSTQPTIALGTNMTDAGGNQFYGSRALARAAGFPVPDYDGTLACLPATPPNIINKAAIVAANMTPGTWADLSTAIGIGPNTTLASVAYNGPFAATIHGASGISSATKAWAGAVYDSDRDCIWFPGGGGHGAYWGNEWYKFDFKTLQFLRATNPSNVGGPPPSGTGINPDGSPGSCHTYTDQCYDKNRHIVIRMCLAGVGDSGDSSSSKPTSFTANPALFDPNSVIPVSYIDALAGGDSGPGVNAFALYDDVSGFSFYISPDQHFSIRKLDLSQASGSQWSSIGSTGAFDGTNGAAALGTAFGDGRRWIVGSCAPFGNPVVNAFPLTGAGAGNIVRPVVTGDTTMASANSPGIDFHPPSGKYVYWGGSGDNTNTSTAVWTLDATKAGTSGDPWLWAKVNAAGGNTITPSGPVLDGLTTNGTFDRWRWLSTYGVFFLYNDVTTKAYFYKPNF